MNEAARISKAAWWVGGTLLFGAAVAGIYRLLSFEIDIDPWDESLFY
jgi:hypothetical protein